MSRNILQETKKLSSILTNYTYLAGGFLTELRLGTKSSLVISSVNELWDFGLEGGTATKVIFFFTVLPGLLGGSKGGGGPFGCCFGPFFGLARVEHKVGEGGGM